MAKRIDVWFQRDGSAMAIADMTTEHIENSLVMLSRNGYVSLRTAANIMAFGGRARGSVYVDRLYAELESRQLYDVISIADQVLSFNERRSEVAAKTRQAIDDLKQLRQVYEYEPEELLADASRISASVVLLVPPRELERLDVAEFSEEGREWIKKMLPNTAGR